MRISSLYVAGVLATLGCPLSVACTVDHASDSGSSSGALGADPSAAPDAGATATPSGSGSAAAACDPSALDACFARADHCVKSAGPADVCEKLFESCKFLASACGPTPPAPPCDPKLDPKCAPPAPSCDPKLDPSCASPPPPCDPKLDPKRAPPAPPCDPKLDPKCGPPAPPCDPKLDPSCTPPGGTGAPGGPPTGACDPKTIDACFDAVGDCYAAGGSADGCVAMKEKCVALALACTPPPPKRALKSTSSGK